MENKFVLLGNGPYENHGCEAIVNGTVDIINSQFGESEFIVASYYNNSDQFLCQNGKETNSKIKHIQHIVDKEKSNSLLYRKFIQAIGSKNQLSSKFANVEDIINDSTAVLSVGGDNYTMDYGLPTRFTDIDDYVLSKGKPIIIWGASIGPFSTNKSYEKYMSKHLSKVTAIFARENETIQYLNSIGVSNNVYRVSDPAFMLKPNEPDYPKILIKKNSIGINISPLMMYYVTEGNKEGFIELSAKIIERIIITTGKNIYMIPHVVSSNNSDYEIMNLVFNKLTGIEKEKVTVISDKYNASEYKWIISQMEIFFGARTHSTIASISSLIPTLSFVYSLKAIGINKDIFGTDKYCIYPNEYNETDLIIKIENLLIDKERIKHLLETKLIETKLLAVKAGNILKDIVNMG